ncbi:MAG TPA: hypothetical protein IAC38_00420 [Candidatus Caccovivens faecavium]|nr:hypothetical protein [Candidatus Caccovivens faecavium]
MKDMINAFDNLPQWLKIVLALPGLDIVWAVYRLCRSIDKQNVLGIVLGVLMILICPIIMWLVDIITLVVYNKVLWID